MPPETPERRVVCENCGEIHYFEEVGTPQDEHPELGTADRLIPADDCLLCNPDLDA